MRRTLSAILLLSILSAAPAARAGAEPSPEPPDRPLTAGFLVVDGVYNSELMAPYDVLQHTVFHVDEAAGGGIRVLTVSPDGEPITTFEGLRLVPDHGFDDVPPLDVLVVPSAEGSMDEDLENRRMIDWVRRTGRKARFVMSLCDGAFVLAEAGLLDGRQATTFPADYQAFSDRFAGVDLKINVSFVHDGPALTSQGGARSYDLAMYLVDLLYGEEAAAGVGRGLLIPWPPEPKTMPNIVVEPAMHAEPEPPAPEGSAGASASARPDPTAAPETAP